jgi:MFS transporter, DHA1 family, tetracycline resistance protein
MGTVGNMGTMGNSKTLRIVFCIVLVDMLGVGILAPVIPLLLTATNYPHTLGLSPHTGYIVLGLLTALFPAMQFIATPILGQLSDKVGRKPVLLFSIAGTVISYILFAIGIITKNIPLLFISRGLDGITGGNIAVAQAAIADSTKPEHRAKSFGIIGAAFGMGFIIGPFLGGVLSDPQYVSWFSATTPFWFAAIASFCNMFAVLFFFKETLLEKKQGLFRIDQSLRNIRSAFISPTLRPLFTASYLFQSGFSFFTTFLGVSLVYKFDFSQGQLGNYFALIGICIVITQGFITGRLAKRFSSETVITYALFVSSAFMFLLYLAQTPWKVYLLTIPNALCIGLIISNFNALISKSAGTRGQGEILGIGASVQALAQTLPPILAGTLSGILSPNSPILIASMIVCSGAFVFIFYTRQKLVKL